MAHAAPPPLPDACAEASVDARDLDAAKGLHRGAEAYFREGRYPDALDAWLTAYRLDCSAHRLLINIGNTLDRLGRPGDAVVVFEEFVAREHLHVPNEEADEEAPLHPVFARIEALKARDAAPALADPLPQDAPESPPPPPESSPVPWALLGVGAASVLGGAALLTAGAVIQHDAAGLCMGVACPPEAQDDGNLAIGLQQGGGAAAVLGLALVSAGGLWLLLDADEEAPEVAVGPGGAAVRWRF